MRWLAIFLALLWAPLASAQSSLNNGGLQVPGGSGGGGSGITQLTGDVSAGPGSGSQAATVNSYNGGTAFGSAAAANTGTSGATLCLLNASCTFSGSNAYGTPASINLTNAVSCTISACVSGLGANVATALGQALNGTGAISATTNPSFVTPALGTIASGNLANGTGYTLTNVVGAGTAAAANTGTSGATLCLLSANCTVSGVWALGAATATSINGDTLTAGSWTLTGSAGKTLTFSNSLALAGTDATTMTFPTTSATIARTDAAQTFTGTQTFSTIVPTTVSVANGGQLQVNGQPLAKGTAPAIASGFGTSPSIVGISTGAFAVTVGTGGTASTGVLTFSSSASHGWSCQAADITTTSAAVSTTKVTANSATSVTVGNFTDVSASGPWTAGDTLLFNCMGY